MRGVPGIVNISVATAVCLTTSPTLAQPKSLIRALRGEVQARPNFWFMRQAGRYLPEYRKVRALAGDFVQLCLTPDLASEITLQPVRRFAMDAAILFADILMVPHGLGQSVAFREGEGPVLEPVRTHAAIAGLESELEALPARLEPIFETVRRVSRDLPLDTALIGFAGSPWTVATYMVEGGSSRNFMTVRRLAVSDPTTFALLIDLLIEATTIYLGRQIDAGAEAIQLFDSWAGALPDGEFQRWCVEPTREIVTRLRTTYPAIPIIGFPKGAGIRYANFATLTGVDAVGIDSTVPVDWAAATLQPGVTVQGNLDPLHLVVGGAAMEAEATRILKALGRGPFVFNLGHGIVPETPPEHVAQLSDLIRRWRH
jgi:uroporphyrinogen decarboxylase